MPNMYTIPYSWGVREIHPSGLLTFQGGKMSSSRQFHVPCRHAEEFALRLLGKWYDAAGGFTSPVLPAPFPSSSGQLTTDLEYGHLSMVAKSFTIEPLCPGCFQSETASRPGEDPSIIVDPAAIIQQAQYFWTDEMVLLGADNTDCNCRVTISYEENPCDCVWYDGTSFFWEQRADILTNTCISVYKNPAYELLTVPNTSLVWESIQDGPDRALKHDSYSYMIISQADILVHWHNVPVKDLCVIQAHLDSYRQTVNSVDWGASLVCDEDGSASVECPDGEICCQDYEAETILFVDYEEDRTQRTDAFYANVGGLRMLMDTTTLKLHFKQKRVVDSSSGNIAGWNHRFNDQQDNAAVNDTWERVKIDKGGGDLRDFYTKKNFVNILNPSY